MDNICCWINVEAYSSNRNKYKRRSLGVLCVDVIIIPERTPTCLDPVIVLTKSDKSVTHRHAERRRSSRQRIIIKDRTSLGLLSL